eukprot:SAG25_NODE_137_length_14197_cov_30.387120_2_plen_63_part_00
MPLGRFSAATDFELGPISRDLTSIDFSAVTVLRIDHHRRHVRRVHTEMRYLARISYTGLPLL